MGFTSFEPDSQIVGDGRLDADELQIILVGQIPESRRLLHPWIPNDRRRTFILLNRNAPHHGGILQSHTAGACVDPVDFPIDDNRAILPTDNAFTNRVEVIGIFQTSDRFSS